MDAEAEAAVLERVARLDPRAHRPLQSLVVPGEAGSSAVAAAVEGVKRPIPGSRKLLFPSEAVRALVASGEAAIPSTFIVHVNLGIRIDGRTSLNPSTSTSFNNLSPNRFAPPPPLASVIFLSLPIYRLSSCFLIEIFPAQLALALRWRHQYPKSRSPPCSTR